MCARELTSCWSVARIVARAACFDIRNRIWGLVRERNSLVTEVDSSTEFLSRLLG